MLVAVLIVAAAPAAAERMTLYSLAAGDSFVGFGREGGIGDLILWNSELQDEQGNRIGTATGSYVRSTPNARMSGTSSSITRGHGRMSLNGVQLPEPETSTLTIVGGTDAYEGITGKIRSTPVEDRARFKYEVDYRTD